MLSVREKGEGTGKMTLRKRHNNTIGLIVLSVFLLYRDSLKSSVVGAHFLLEPLRLHCHLLNLNQHFFIESDSPSDPTNPSLFGNHFFSPLYWNEFYVYRIINKFKSEHFSISSNSWGWSCQKVDGLCNTTWENLFLHICT